MLTFEEPLSCRRRGRLHDRHYRTRRTLGKIDTGDCLIDLEGSKLACPGVDVIPVVQAERHVAVLLDLEHHDVAAQSVNRPGGQEDCVPGLGSEAREVVRQRLVGEVQPQALSSGTCLEAGIYAAFRPGLQHDPCFCLTGLARGKVVRLPVRWVYLDREQVVGVEELQQQREPNKAAEPMFPVAVRGTSPAADGVSTP